MAQIENIEIRFSGSANFKEVYAEAAKLNAQLKAMQGELAKLDDKAVRDLRSGFNMRVRDMGGVYSESVKAKTATQAFTESLIKQDVTIAKAYKNRKLFNDVLREQYQLQKMVAVQWGRTASGTVTADVMIPKGTSSEVERLSNSFKANAKAVATSRWEMMNYAKGTAQATAASERFSVASNLMHMRLGLAADTLSSMSANMVKWGKNTQWAGRQLMVGFTVPFLAFAAVAGMAANNVDKEMTRVLKVYDFSAEAATNSAVREAEANDIRVKSLDAAKNAARMYGVQVQDTLNIEAELAATGMKGNDLIARTSVLNKAMIMGELDKQQAIKASTALQTTYGHSTEQINQDFEFMATMANATSVSMSDFVEGLPRGAQVLKNAGVELKQLGVLMVALKQNSIATGEGVNGLRTIAQRLTSVTPAAEKVWARLLPGKKPIQEFVDQNEGQLIPTLTQLGESMKGLGAYQKQQILTQLFGKQRLNIGLAVMDSLVNKTNQMTKALEAADMSTEQIAQTAAVSLAQVTNSASNKIARAIASIKAELSDLGATFLPIAAQVMGWVGGMLKAINGLSPMQKKFIVFAAAGMAVAGVLTMMVGLVSNFVGTLLGAVTALSKLGLKFRATTVEQKAQAMMAEKSAALWRDQGLAAQTLSSQLQGLVKSLDRVTTAQQQAAAAAGLPAVGSRPMATQYAGTKAGMPGPNIPAGTSVVRSGSNIRQATPAEVSAARNAAHLEAISENETRIAATSAATKRNWGAIAGSTAAVATAGVVISAGMAKSEGSSRNLMDNLMNTLIAASLLGPTLGKALNSRQVQTALGSVKDAFNMGRAGRTMAGGGLVGGLRAAIPAASSLVGVIARFAGPVGLLVTAGLAMKKVHDGMEQARKKQIQINDSAKDWATILGFTYQQQAKSSTATKSQADSAVSLAAKFREANGEAAKALDIAAKSKNAEDLVNAAIAEGIKVRMHGGDAGQARLAAQTALAAAGKNAGEIQKLMLDVDAKINFGDMKAVARAQATEFGKTFSEVSRNEIKADGWMTRLWESAKGGLTSGARQAAANAGKEFWNGFDGQESAQAKKEYFDSVEKDFASRTADLVKNINNSKEFKQANGGRTVDWATISGWANNPNGSKAGLFDTGIPAKYADETANAADAEREFVQAIAKERGIAPEVIKGLANMTQLRKALGVVSISTADAQAKYNEELETAKKNGLPLNDAEALLVLNRWRAAAGLGGATSVAQGFGEALQGASGAVDQFGQSIDANAMSAEEWGQKWADATKNAMSGAQGMAFDQAEVLRAEQQSAIMESIDKKYQARLDAADAASERKNKTFDNRADALDKLADKQDRALDSKQKSRQKAVAAAWDARIDKVQAAIDAEQKAEDQRQKIFEAEKERLNRLSQMANMNIDFNVALNTGNLDSAAKVFNDMQAQQNEWDTTDAAGSSQSASEARKAKAESQKSALEKGKDAALESLKTKEDAEKRALKDKQDREKKALAAEKERYAKSVEANKKALSEQSAAEKKANEAFLLDKKHTLDMELMTIRASTPRNKAEYDAQIKQIEAAYDKYGISLKGKGRVWTGYIGDYLTSNVAASAKSMANDINWGAYAKSITNDFTTGAFNMSVAEFGKWITTGKAPSDAFTTPKRASRSQAEEHSTGGHAVRHEGGLLGSGGNNSRKGIPASAGTYPSEVNLLAKKGEYVMQQKAVNRLGTDVMDQINQGQLPMGGANIGLAGIIMGGLAGQMKNMMQMGTLTAATRKIQQDGMPGQAFSAKTGAAGKYGKISLNAEQLRNAAAIMATGKSMGASNRDLTIAIMTAMQESTLRNLNYGDRDSLGLFQQRPSQGWGTAEQIMNPSYAASKFFKGLFGVKGRDKMPMTLAAQAVQRSAFPLAYAKWQDMASAIVNGTKFSGAEGMGIEGMLKALQGVGTAGSTGQWMKPLDNYRVSSEYGMRVNPVTGQYKLHDGIDLAAAGGTPIHAADGGRILNAGASGGYGNYTVIQHGNGLLTGYAHQSRLNVKSGQAVRKGQLIGAVGTTGNSTGNHLHFQMGKGAGNWKNPRQFIPGLAKGGYTLNDGYAMLHKNETVLTADLSDKLKVGLGNLATGSNSEYNVTVDLRGAYVNKEIDIERAVNIAIEKRESKMGRNRKVSA